ncbi:MAG: hypothetical protein U0Q18_06630 [Bryobacteraceae bacterium]
MNPLEDELRSALRRREPSPDFIEKVLARVKAEQAAVVVPIRRQSRTWVRWVAAMAACLLLAAGLFEYRQYQGQQAREKVLLAMRIAAVKLNKAQKKVQMLNAAHRSNS